MRRTAAVALAAILAAALAACVPTFPTGGAATVTVVDPGTATATTQQQADADEGHGAGQCRNIQGYGGFRPRFFCNRHVLPVHVHCTVFIFAI